MAFDILATCGVPDLEEIGVPIALLAALFDLDLIFLTCGGVLRVMSSSSSSTSITGVLPVDGIGLEKFSAPVAMPALSSFAFTPSNFLSCFLSRLFSASSSRSRFTSFLASRLAFMAGGAAGFTFPRNIFLSIFSGGTSWHFTSLSNMR